MNQRATASATYTAVHARLSAGECVILDGANATELQRQGVKGYRLSDAAHWGFDALEMSPHAVSAVHASYIAAGAEIITTNTYAVIDAPSYASLYDSQRQQPLQWMDLARTAVTLARDVAGDSGCAVAFSIGGGSPNSASVAPRSTWRKSKNSR